MTLEATRQHTEVSATRWPSAMERPARPVLVYSGG